jgi:hypothetical protein
MRVPVELATEYGLLTSFLVGGTTLEEITLDDLRYLLCLRSVKQLWSFVTNWGLNSVRIETLFGANPLYEVISYSGFVYLYKKAALMAWSCKEQSPLRIFLTVQPKAIIIWE